MRFERARGASRHTVNFFVMAFLLVIAASLGNAQENRSPEVPDAASEVVARPQVPEAPPDEEELNVVPDDEGKLRFNFQGQPWESVLGWLAKVSSLSLDWQELPAGFLNLHTQQGYTVDEARDLINRHLLDRGFTMLKHGEVLSVVRITKLDPSMVPRLEPDELLEAMPHEFVRVTFPLEWMTAETAVEDLKPLISPNGKLTMIKSSNHLEAMDAVANLRDIRRLTSDPESPRGPRRLVRQFRLEYARAADVQQQLHKLLGLDKSTSSDPAAVMQQMAKFMKEAGVNPGDLSRAKSTQAPPVHLVANVRDNSILVNAPADQMAIVTEAIKVIDVPNDRSRSVLRNSSRVQTYTLTVADPDAILKMLQELADLSPETRLQVDRKNRTIIAHASLGDHLTIRTLIDKLDGAVRNFRVITLTRLDAEYVAGSLNLVMGGGDTAKRQSSKDAEDEARRFRVVADVEKNRLLLWVNDDELADVRQLLVELGETAEPVTDSPTTVRVLETPDPKQVEELLHRLRDNWPALAPNPLEFGPGAQLSPASSDREDSTPTAEPRTTPARARPRNSAAADREKPDGTAQRDAIVTMKLAGFVARDDDREPKERPVAAGIGDSIDTPDLRSASVPPVRIERDMQGRLIVASQDPRAVDLVQKLLAQYAPADGAFHVIRMKHKTTWAYSIAENLRQFFEERKKGEEKRQSEQIVARWFDPAGGKWIESPRSEAARQKKVRNPPRFIVDEDSNSILVVEADAEQIRTAEKLIEMYDTPETQESPVVRVTKLVQVKYGNPKQVCDTLKDVYKDLLAATPEPPPPTGRRRRPIEPTYTLPEMAGKGMPGTLLRYKGQLAIGVDESSSSIVISAPGALVETISETVTALDNAARENKPRLQVYRAGKGIDAVEVQKRLNQAMRQLR